MEFVANSNMVNPKVTENLVETSMYNQVLVLIGFISVIAVVGIFSYFLLKKRH